MHGLIAAGIAFAVAAIAPLGVIPFLRRLGAFDVPTGRSLHENTAVRGVGLAVLLGFLAACAYLAVAESEPLFVILAAAGLSASAIGLVEDIRGVSVRRRAAAQVLLGLAATAALIVATNASWFLLPVGAIGIAAYINVANFMDGVDGISSLHGIIVGAALAVAGLGTDRGWLLAAGLVTAASFAAFLPWNLLRHGTVLGDAGSYLLGGAIAAISTAALLDGVPVVAILGPVLIYLVDTATTLLRRRARGDDLARAHRDHVFQRLAFRRMGHMPTALLVTA
ncbi:MAG: UDP-phosphate glycosyltransferase, partial [Rhodoglobus sp.]